MDFDFFALTTPIGRKIEEATSELLVMEDWSLNLEITDEVNQENDGPRDAVRALKKRLGNKNPKVVGLALTVLETCTMNCGPRFATAMATKDFMDRLAGIALLKTPEGEKARLLIATWVAGFRDRVRDMQPLYDMYSRLRAEGIDFPAVDPTKTAPITLPEQIPDESVSPQRPSRAQPQPQPRPGSVPGAGATTAAAGQRPRPGSTPQSAQGGFADERLVVEFTPAVPTDEEVARLRDNLQVVLGNVGVMNEMLQALGAEEHPGELLMEINATTREMHRRVLLLINQVDHPELMAELISVNEKLLATLDAYDVCLSVANSVAGTATSTATAAAAVAGAGIAGAAATQRMASHGSDGDDLLLELSPTALSPEALRKGVATMALEDVPLSTQARPALVNPPSKSKPVASSSYTVGSDTTDTPDELTEEDFDAFLNQASTAAGSGSARRPSGAAVDVDKLNLDDLDELLK